MNKRILFNKDINTNPNIVYFIFEWSDADDKVEITAVSARLMHSSQVVVCHNGKSYQFTTNSIYTWSKSISEQLWYELIDMGFKPVEKEIKSFTLTEVEHLV